MSVFKDELFRDKTVCITGGTSGIGRSLAAAFCSHGANVAIIGRDEARAVAAQATMPRPDAVFPLTADVRNFADLERCVRLITQRWSSIDIVIAAAAGNFTVAAKDMSANAFRSVVDIDLIGTFNIFRTCFEHLRRPGAVLIAMSAAQGHQALPLQAHACAAKAGIENLVRALGGEWGPEGVRVLGVAPGQIQHTGAAERLSWNGLEGYSAADIDAIRLRAVPVKRYGKCADIDNLCLFLASEAASFMTGTTVDCDGGYRVGFAGARHWWDLKGQGA